VGLLLTGGQAVKHAVGQVCRSGNLLPVLSLCDPGSRARGTGQAVSVEGRGCPTNVPLLPAGARSRAGSYFICSICCGYVAHVLVQHLVGGLALW